VWSGIVSLIVILGIAGLAALRLVNAFSSGGLTTEVTIPESRGDATPSGDALQVTQGIVTLQHPDAGLVALMIGTIVLAAVAGILVVISYFVLTAEITRERTFSRRAIRSLYAMSAVVLITTVGCYAMDMAIGRAVRAAAGLAAVGTDAPVSYWMGFAVGGGIGLVATAFQRGARLQRETEGLV
jgi:hypothetical protein